MKVDVLRVGTMSPGTAFGVVTHDVELQFIARASPAGTSESDRAAARIATDAMHKAVSQHADVVRRFSRTQTPLLRERLVGILEDGARRAAQETFAFARRHPGVSVALDALILAGTEVFIVHVGDGRIYLARRGILHQLTVDHIDPTTTPPTRRHALGPRPAARVESLCMETADGDRFVCLSANQAAAQSEDDLLQALIGGPLRDLAARMELTDEAIAALGVGDTDISDTGAQRLAILAPMPLFTHCSERQLRQVAAATHPRRLGTGTVLFHQGDAGEELFLLIAGKVRIERDGQHIVSIGPGSNFGEMAMLDQPIRSATAVAETPAELLVIKKEAFFALLRGQPQLAVKILWNMALTLSANLRKSTARIAEITGDASLPRPPTPDQPLEPDDLDRIDVEQTM